MNTTFKKTAVAAMLMLGTVVANAQDWTVTVQDQSGNPITTTFTSAPFTEAQVNAITLGASKIQVIALSQYKEYAFYSKVTPDGIYYGVYGPGNESFDFIEESGSEGYKKLFSKDEAERKAAEEKRRHDEKVAARTRDTNQAVAGAIAVNIISDEFINPALKEYGASVGSTVGGNFENPELRVGFNVDLSQHFGEDFEGVSVNAGWGVESGELSVGARKTWRVAEYVTTSVGASIGAEGVRVGPELMLGDDDFGVGVAMWGPLPIPQIKIFGYTASIVPHLALANAIVGGTTIAYKAIRSEMRKEGLEAVHE